MTQIYANPSLKRRMDISVLVTAVAILFGCWEIWSSLSGIADGMNIMFAIFFFGGAVYAAKMIRDGTADTVLSLDVDAGGASTVALWRPFSKTEIGAPLDQLTDWQLQRRGGRTPVPILTAHHPGHPRPLEFELGPGITVTEAFRALAPEAFAAFEGRAG